MSREIALNPTLFSSRVKQRATRDGFGDGLVAVGEANDRVVALAADLTESVRMDGFKKRFPDRFIEVGVAEQNLVTVASGMAAAGFIPFAASYATFSPGRNWEQIRTTICYNNQPVIIVGSHAGLSVGPDGATHQALEDIALMRVLPNMTVVVPCDAWEARKITIALATLGRPAYIRLARSTSPLITTSSTPFTIGKCVVIRRGTDVTVLACGPLLYEALVAARVLAKHAISLEVVNVATIKPLDAVTILRSARKTKLVVTVEEHQVVGGLGGAVAELLATLCPLPLERVGVHDRFGESGQPAELLLKYQLDHRGITAAVRRVLKRRKSR